MSVRDGDGIDVVEDELAAARADLVKSERADLEDRVVDRGQWRDSLERKRLRVAELEELRDDLVAAEESEAELRHGGER